MPFHVGICDTVLTRNFSQHPFVPSDEAARAHICDEILTIQAMGLKKVVAYECKISGCRHFGRSGFYIGSACHGKGVRYAGTG